MLRKGSFYRRGLGLLGVVLSSSGLCACDPVAGGAHPEDPLWTYHPSYAMNVEFERNLVAVSRRQGEPYERGRPAIDHAHRRVFVGSSDHGLYAVRADSGDIDWRFETLAPVQCEPLYDAVDDVLYFGSNDGALYKLDASTGRMLWRFATNAEVARKPVKSGDSLYFVNANDTVIAVNAHSGKRLWSQHLSPALGMEISGYAGVLVKNGSVFTAFSTGIVTAFDAQTGRERWEPVDLSAEAEQSLGTVPTYLDVDTTPVWAQVGSNNAVIVGSYEGGAVALDAETGNQLWANRKVVGISDVTLWSQPAHTGPKPSDGMPPVAYPERRLVLVSTGTSGLWALDTDTGAEMWRRDLPRGGTNRPVPISGALLMTTTEQGLYLVHPIDGGIIDGIHTEVGFSMAPAVYGDRAFVLSNSGKFLALSVAPPN